MNLLNSIGRRWAVISVIALVGLMCGAGYSLMQPKKYSATVRMYVVSGTADLLEAYQGVQAAQDSIRSFATLASDPSVVRRALDASGVGMSPDEVIADMEATVAPQTVVLDITVRTADAADAPKLARAIAEDLTSLIAKLEAPAAGGPGALRLQIVDPSTRGAVREPVFGPAPLGIGFFGGALVGVIVALVWDRRHGSASGSAMPVDERMAESDQRPTTAQAVNDNSTDSTTRIPVMGTHRADSTAHRPFTNRVDR